MLPPALQSTLDTALQQLPFATLQRAAQALSERYMGIQGDSMSLLQDEQDALAYAAFRLPATFAAVNAALTSTLQVLPDFAPVSLLDVGAGPGTVLWAAGTLLPALQKATLLEREKDMRALCQTLLTNAPFPLSDHVSLEDVDLSQTEFFLPHDLVTISYVLGEMTPAAQGPLLTCLWQATQGVLLLVEPGTPKGFATLRRAREQLLQAGAHIIAPCVMEKPCPMTDDDWCHFTTRVARSKLHMQIKGGGVPYEDEKYAYLAVSRKPAALAGGRVLRHPQVRSGHIGISLCTKEGILQTTVTKKDKQAFRHARSAKAGSLFPLC